MDSTTILVLVLCAGVVALLTWFEINSLRNEASKKAGSTHVETLPEESQTAFDPQGDKKKAA